MSKKINSPSSSYSSIRNRKSASPNLGYGSSLFKALFILFLVLGIVTVFFAFFTEEYFSLFLTIGLNSIIFSFVFKFMESVILLLKEIRQELNKGE